MKSLQEELNAVLKCKPHEPITRYRYANGDYSANLSMKLVEAIGKKCYPGFVIDDDNRFAYENFVKWLHGNQTMRAIDPDTKREVPGDMLKGIYIAGGIGTGKTRCTEVMENYARRFEFLIKYDDDENTESSIGWRSVSSNEIVEQYKKNVSLKEFETPKILCIQDLGGEPSEAVAMGNRVNVLREVLQSRGSKPDCLTIITSIYAMNSPTITETYGERVADRLYGMCNYLELYGGSRRRRKADE